MTKKEKAKYYDSIEEFKANIKIEGFINSYDFISDIIGFNDTQRNILKADIINKMVELYQNFPTQHLTND